MCTFTHTTSSLSRRWRETSDGLDMYILPHVTDPDLIIFQCFEALSIRRHRSVNTFIYTGFPVKFPVTQESAVFQSAFRNILYARNVLIAVRSLSILVFSFVLFLLLCVKILFVITFLKFIHITLSYKLRLFRISTLI